jgi:hypothetical protein
VRPVDAIVPNGKQLLLSYVRAEAAQHALLLKEELSQLGYSVFLVSKFLNYILSIFHCFVINLTGCP